MNYEGTYPPPVYGISTLSPRDRKEGLAEEQINLRSDPVTKLTKRPQTRWVKELANIAGAIQNHEYMRGDYPVRIIITTAGQVKAYIQDVEKTVTGNLYSYIAGNVGKLVLKTVNDTTFVLNKSKRVSMVSSTDVIEKVAHINVTAALNYGETVTIKAGVGGLYTTYTYVVPDLGATPNYDAADKARATNAVAEGLTALINADPFAYVVARASGSTVAMWPKSDPSEWAVVEVASGQGDKQIVAVNSVISDIAGLPRYAVHGTRIKVQPNPDSNKGVYYLEARAIRNNPVIPPLPENRILEEVVWTESRAHDEKHKLDETTLPHVITYNYTTDTFTCGVPEVGWSDRLTGDNKTCKIPDFVGTTIEHIGYFQKRLVLLSANTVIMSKTDDIYNFWRQSAVSLLVTDPVSISANTTDIDRLNFISNHNKDLLIVAGNAQLKIPGDVPVTPETIAMPVVTSFNVTTTTEPVALGNSVMIPISYGSSSGLIRYEREQNREQDNAMDISAHVVGMIKGKITHMSASSNLETILVMTTDSNKTIYVYEQFTYSEENLQRSWSKWEFPFEVVSLNFVGTNIHILYKETANATRLHVAIMELNNIDAFSHIFVDKYIAVRPVGNVITLPLGYDATNCIAVSLSNLANGLRNTKIPFTQVGNTLVLDRTTLSGEWVIVGSPFTCVYRPTRPFRRDQAGNVITSDKLRIAKFILHVVDTGSVELHTVSQFYDHAPQTFISRKLGTLSGALGTRGVETGDIVFNFTHDASLATAEFRTNDHLGLTISGISWVGQYHQRVRRM